MIYFGVSDCLKSLNLVEDKAAKSEAYYCTAEPLVFDDEVLAWLKEKLDKTSGNTVRICVHREAAAPFHEMLIAHKRGGEFKPHKHLLKTESYHVIEGKLRVNRFDDQGKHVSTLLLGPHGSGLPFLHRLPVNVWHSTEPDGEYVIFHEAKPGPFVSSDNVYPHWK